MATQPIELQTLGDVLLEERGIEVRCKCCGRRQRTDLRYLIGRLEKCDWSTPLHEAAQYLRCQACAAKNAQIIVLKGELVH